ncbi:hypothetical protein ACIBTZ_01730 [Micromonospora sp. NPDC049460]|uniref:hypothetical protein n=1 Tax=unclassified Micromonospora TaxID=2617518 RepID=UPI0037205AEE
MTSVRDHDGRTEVRMVAQTDRHNPGRRHGDVRAAWRADRLGRPGDLLTTDGDGVVRPPMRAWETATMRLDLN